MKAFLALLAYLQVAAVHVQQVTIVGANGVSLMPRW